MELIYDFFLRFVPSTLLIFLFMNFNLTAKYNKYLQTLIGSAADSDDASEKISIKTKNETVIIDLKNTLYLSSNAHKLIITENGSQKEINYKLSEATKLLPVYFIQCHKSFVVNAYHVASYNFRQIVLDNKEILPVSRKYSQSMRNAMLKNKCGIL